MMIKSIKSRKHAVWFWGILMFLTLFCSQAVYGHGEAAADHSSHNEWMEGFIESILETPKDRLTIYQIRKIEEVYYQLLDK